MVFVGHSGAGYAEEDLPAVHCAHEERDENQIVEVLQIKEASEGNLAVHSTVGEVHVDQEVDDESDRCELEWEEDEPGCPGRDPRLPAAEEAAVKSPCHGCTDYVVRIGDTEDDAEEEEKLNLQSY